MEVLFVCMGNVCRSQMAEAGFNQRSAPHRATSAGVVSKAAGFEGHRVKETSPEVVKAMQEIGPDLSDAVSKQLTEEMVGQADVVVHLAEREHAPAFLDRCKTVLLYEVQDPVTTAHEEHVKTRERVQAVVSEALKLLEG